MRAGQKKAWRDHATRWRCICRGVLVACALVPVTMALGNAYGQSLGQVVETALKTNPKVLAAAAQRQAVVHDLAQAQAGYFPTLDVNLADGKEDTVSPQVIALGGTESYLIRREAGATLTQKLYDGKATSSEIDRQRALLEAATHRLTEAREQIALQAAGAYLDVLKNRNLVKLANDDIRAHLDILAKVRLRVEGGVSQKADLQQALGRMALAKSVASARAGKLRESEADYQTVVGNLPGTLADPVVKATPLATSGAVDTDLLTRAIQQDSATALKSNPTLNAANADVSAAEAAVRGAKAPYLPRLNLEANVSRDQNIAGIPGDFNTDSLMLVMHWNLFRGGADQAQERAYVQRKFAAMDTAASTRRDIEGRVAVALHAKATSEERLGYLQEHATLSADVLESYQEQLDLGRRTLLDVLNAENELFSARSDLAEGRYDDMLNQYAVEAAQGLLVQSLGITSAN